MIKNKKIIFCIFALIVSGFIFYTQRIKIKELLFERKIDLPSEISRNEINFSGVDLGEDNNVLNEDVEMIHESSLRDDINTANDDNEIVPNPRPQIKTEINLKVPFTIQSPDQKWNDPYEDGCEEASVLMVYSYLKDKKITSESAMKDIYNMVVWQNQNFGGHFDISASTTLYLAKEFYSINGEVINLYSIDDVINILSRGDVLILPTAGRELGNPNFRNEGPLYHMLVVKGFTKDGFIITNDPGTRKGENYVYKNSVLWEAIADWDYIQKTPNMDIKVGILLK